MKNYTCRYYRLLVAAGFVFCLIVAAWSGWRWLTAGEVNSDDVFSRLRVGMGQREALDVLQTFDQTSCQYVWGTTIDGREFSTLQLPALKDIPPSDEIEYCMLEAEDRYGRTIKVTLGHGGIVSSKHLSPGIWNVRYNKAYCSLRDKPYRKLLSKYSYIASGLAVGLLLVSVWMIRQRAMKGKICRETY